MIFQKIKNGILFFLVFLATSVYSQIENYPVFKECDTVAAKSMKPCFYNTTNKYFFKEFKEPAIIKERDFKGTINAVFLVTNQGDFRLIYVNSPYKEVQEEVKRVFANFPKITPATFNSHNVEMRFVLPITFPISEDSAEVILIEKQEEKKLDIQKVVAQTKLADSTFLELNSQLTIPFTHRNYVDYEYALHKASGTHTASKPYLYSEVNKYYDLSAERKQFLKPEKTSWWGRKLWNEHLLQVKKEDYWFTLDFLVDLQLGKDNSDSQNYTFNNTRTARINGGFGNNFSFSATIYESQGRFAEYVNNFINNPTLLFKPFNIERVVPGRGKAKPFKDNASDYPVAEGYLSYTPSKIMQFQFGHGKNFIGDGYRSFLLSDVASPMPYLKAEFTFWKFKYSNIWMWGRDLTKRSTINNLEYARKYIATHYLSINITDRLNIGIFETAISSGEQGFDVGFLNPLIFYRSVEFNRGEDAGNAMVGLTAKYKLSEKSLVYGQLVIDEFSVGNLGNLSDWRNKFAFQVGGKYFDAFEVDNLFLQGEFNYARPYTFAHQTSVLNYGHFSQPLGHAWGANFWEAVAIARYKKDRWSGSLQLTYGQKGFDKDDTTSFGGNIYQSYNNRYSETNNSIAQGNTANIFLANVQGNYLLNPSNNLNLFAGLYYRNFSSEVPTPIFKTANNIWFTLGIKADLFNWYLDF